MLKLRRRFFLVVIVILFFSCSSDNGGIDGGTDNVELDSIDIVDVIGKDLTVDILDIRDLVFEDATEMNCDELPGKRLYERKCYRCHGDPNIEWADYTREDWQQLLRTHNMGLTPEEQQQLIDYLLCYYSSL